MNRYDLGRNGMPSLADKPGPKNSLSVTPRRGLMATDGLMRMAPQAGIARMAGTRHGSARRFKS